jgi:choline dehydrogenase-like flavoprotein
MAKFSKSDNSVAVIIGSGAGGGVLGMELALKGIKTVILEAGGRHNPQDFVNDE